MQHFLVRRSEKPGALLYLLDVRSMQMPSNPAHVVMTQKVIGAEKQTVIFAATKHMVEYLKELLAQCGIDSAAVYGSLDPTGLSFYLN